MDMPSRTPMGGPPQETGATESLMTYLRRMYEQTEWSGLSTEQQRRYEGVEGFVRFCEDHLDENRPVEIWHPDRNVGIRLSNNQWLTVAPPTAEAGSGSTRSTSAVNITGGRV